MKLDGDLLIMNTFSVLVRGFGLLEVMNQKRVQGVLGSYKLWIDSFQLMNLKSL